MLCGMSNKESTLDAVIVPVTPLEQNCTIFWCTQSRQAAVIDPGGDVPLILQALNEKDITAEKILLTHGHFDHAGGALELAGILDVPILGPQEEDAFWLDGIEKAEEMYGLAGGRNVRPDSWLADGDRVELGELSLDVLHTPGHTPGHVVFYHAPSKLAQVGDVLFRGSVGRTDFPRGDHAALISSIKTRLFPLGDDVTFIPGHGPTGTFGEERRTNPFLRG